MAGTLKPRLSHLGIFAKDMDKMVDFFTRVMGLTISDRGEAHSAPVELVFMSSDPDEHHQIVLVSGKPEDANFNVAQQISFLVDDLDQLRTMHDKLKAEGLEIARVTTHGNAWSVYFDDPEGNRLEIYANTPWHVPQPHVHPFDFSLSNEEIIANTEAHCRTIPGFQPIAERREEMARRIG